jgi:hypothetical protein
LDGPGATDNALTFLIDEVVLKAEAVARLVFKSVTRLRLWRFVTKDHGYRRSDKDLIDMASDCGFKLVAQENYDFTAELMRSSIFARIMRIVPITKVFFRWLGRSAPYTRMYHFQAKNEGISNSGSER